MRRYGSVTIDLDPMWCYYGIHGLGRPPEAVRGLIMQMCVPRFVEILSRRGINATFFVVGQELEAEYCGARAGGTCETVAQLVATGHEVGNHSHRHRYGLGGMSRAVIAEEIQRADGRLREVTGQEIVGFRAPGYNVSRVLISEIARLGYRYDSSVFPCPG